MNDYEELVNRPISNVDIEKYLQYFSDEKIRHVHINDLTKYTLEELYDDNRRAFVVLFVPNRAATVGHWICLFRRSDAELELFDSLGVKSDYLRDLYGPVKDFCLRERCSLNFNNYAVQQEISSTCARWVIFRIMMQHFDNKSFFKFLARNFNFKDLNDKIKKKLDYFVVDLIRFF